MAGVALGQTSIDQGNFNTSSTTLGLFGRYYIQGEVFLGLGYQSTTIKDVDGSANALSLQAGYAAFLNDNITIEPALVYAVGMGDNEANSFALNIGFGVYLGR